MMTNTSNLNSTRLSSLDVFRGMTMFLLIAEAAHVYHAGIDAAAEGTMAYSVLEQFHHHPWNGLRFWDLIQPFFMFIVGVAMPFSLNKRLGLGDSWNQVLRHIVYRCFILLLLGVGLHCVYRHELVWELWNVLVQLSFTILIAFLIMRLPIRTQFLISLALLALTEILYRSYDASSPFVKDQNFGSWMDMVLMNKINSGGGWVAINCIPTAAHTIWGVICGLILSSDRSEKEKIKYFLIIGVIGLVIGYGLDFLGITPIIKRISTISFVFASGGWCILVLAFMFWLVDVKKRNQWIFVFTVVGMNSIFIYIFSETVGSQWVRDFAFTFTNGFLSPVGLSEPVINILNAFVVLAIFWYLCYFLYKRRIFIKI